MMISVVHIVHRVPHIQRQLILNFIQFHLPQRNLLFLVSIVRIYFSTGWEVSWKREEKPDSYLKASSRAITSVARERAVAKLHLGLPGPVRR